MLKHPGNHIGDVWFYPEENRVHGYYLTCPDTIKPHTEWDIGHATSTNLADWHIEDPALVRAPRGMWNDSYATGCVFKAGGRYAMFFTSRFRAETGIAWSEDLFHWELDSGNPNTSADPRYYELEGVGKRKFRHWRDPFVVKDGDRWLQLVCASDLNRPVHVKGTIGLAESTDLQHWSVLPPLEVEPFCEEMECPQLLVRNNLYYLFFSTLRELIAPAIATNLKDGPRTTSYVMISETLLGPYRLAKHPQVIPTDFPQQPYASQIVSFQGKDYCLGTIWEDGKSYIGDPIPVTFGKEGIYV